MRILNTAKTSRPEELRDGEFLVPCQACGARHATTKFEPAVTRDNEGDATVECMVCGLSIEFIVPSTKGNDNGRRARYDPFLNIG